MLSTPEAADFIMSFLLLKWHALLMLLTLPALKVEDAMIQGRFYARTWIVVHSVIYFYRNQLGNILVVTRGIWCSHVNTQAPLKEWVFFVSDQLYGRILHIHCGLNWTINSAVQTFSVTVHTKLITTSELNEKEKLKTWVYLLLREQNFSIL